MSVADVPFTVPEKICRDFARSSRLEWLDTNHTGAFAMGTVAGVNTRRYHSLLVASFNPPADRYALLSRVEEQVVVGEQRFELATVEYPGTVQPHGFDLLEGFGFQPFPSWRYRCGGAAITKTLCLLDGQQSVLVRYESTEPCRLKVRFFLAFRDYHSLTHRNEALRNDPNEEPGRILLSPYPDLPSLAILHSGVFERGGVWYENHEYARELERGLDFREDLFSPGAMLFDLTPESPCFLLATLDSEIFPAQLESGEIDAILLMERKRRQFGTGAPAGSLLERALDQFRVTRSDFTPTLIAGYPWFTDWSRDTLISLPALRSAGFSDGETRAILETLIAQRSQGLVPNRFSDKHSEPEYNTADASLWLFVAAHHFLESTNDLEFLRSTLYPALADTAAWHRRGTHYNIHVDPEDHLLWAGSPETQLTWMDANVGGSPVTSRFGKPVEINALWYNALCILAACSAALGLAADRTEFEAEAAVVRASFERLFWNPNRGCLFDVVRPSNSDSSLRPNQLFAASLPFPLLTRDRARRVVDVVRNELLTPVGVRTLEPRDPRYCARFEGAMAERDACYHQGTVWPWLIGPFISAYLYAYDDSPDAVAFCRRLIRGLESEWTACCLGSLSEVYDADPPHRPGGCPAQLWSVAQFMLACERVGS